jgi:hypothetical protein
MIEVLIEKNINKIKELNFKFSSFLLYKIIFLILR